MSHTFRKVFSVVAVFVSLAVLSTALVSTARADHRHAARHGGGHSGGYSGGYGGGYAGGYSGGYRAGYAAPAAHHHHGPDCGCGCRSQHHHAGYRGGVIVQPAPYGGYQPLPPAYGYNPQPHGGVGIYGRHFNFSFGY